MQVNDPTVTTLANCDNLNMQYLYMPTVVISQLQLSPHPFILTPIFPDIITVAGACSVNRECTVDNFGDGG